jgi:HD-GYP domain-containing protein (c-di-GMP phosphodiesterase class II)
MEDAGAVLSEAGSTFIMPDSVDPRPVLKALAQAMEPAGSVASAHLWLLDQATETLRLVDAVGPLPPAALPVARHDTVLGRALAESVDIIAPLSRRRGPNAETPFWRVATPLEAGNVSGVAAVDFRGDLEPDRLFVIKATRIARPTLVGVLAMHVANQELSATHALLGAAEDLSRLLDPSAVVQSILSHAVEMAGADTASVMLTDAGGRSLTIARARGLPQEIVDTTRLTRGEGIAGLVLASDRPLVVENTPGRRTPSRRRETRSAVSVPIADAEGTLGVLNVGSKTYSTRLSQTTLETLESLGRIGATALRNARAMRKAGDLYFDTLKTLALALETKDPCSHGGTERVVTCATALGRAMGLDGGELRALEIAALLHDIGMIATGDTSAVRKRPLTTIEWGLLKMHPVVAAELLEQAPTLKDVAPIVYHHHEHYDGTGYASGLAGEAIPLAARVLAVADAYVAMTSDRPYRRAMPQDEALAELDNEAGTQFDPHVVDAMHSVIEADRVETDAWCA